MIDWSAVPLPPWWIERAAVRRAALDRAVARVREIVAASSDLRCAIVFGSYAIGRVGPESDLDLILVTTQPANGDPGLRYARLVTRLALEVPCDLLVYEPDEFDRLTRKSAIVAQACREGIRIDAAAPA